MNSSELYKRIFSSIILITLAILLISEGETFFNLFLIICLLISVYEWFKMSFGKMYFLPGIIYIAFSFYAAYYFRTNFNENGILFFFFVVSICIATDIGGYVFGNLFKGPKLTSISPKKTYSGVFGSYVISMIFGSLFLIISDIQLNVKFFLIIFTISTMSQVGDILVSYFKRKSNLKDTGKLIPGHGGILDRLDGMIFTFPLLFFFQKLLESQW